MYWRDFCRFIYGYYSMMDHMKRLMHKCFHGWRRKPGNILPAYFSICLFIPLIAAGAEISNTTSGLLLDNSTVTTRESREIQCLPIRHAYGGKGIDGLQVPRKATAGDHLKICSQETTCCTAEMETKLSALARSDYDKLLHEYINRFKSLLVSRTTKFDDFFTELIRNARHNLHDMFLKTYGRQYQENSVVFTDLFDDLERYYRGNRGNVDLQASLNRFFIKLYQKMFNLLNGQYSLDYNFLQCLAKHMEKTRPFDDAAEKLTQQIKRSFLEARTFVQALAIGRDTARTASEIPLTQHCAAALTKMMYCPQCRGLQSIKPCSPYCLGVMKSCLAQHIELDSEWNQYIDALLLLAERLRGPFNIETVVAPIDVKISEVIMNLQENGATISTKVFHACGRPRLARRAVPTSTLTNRTKESPAPLTSPVGPAGAVTLESLSKEIKEKLAPTKDFWSSLPAQLCADYGKNIKSPVLDDCWNGETKAKTATSAIEALTRTAKMKSAETVDNGPKISNPGVTQQIHQLRLATTRLKQAYNGTDVESIETVSDDEDIEEPESSGVHIDVEGSGSGDGPTDEPDDTEDNDPEEAIEGSGSGVLGSILLSTQIPSITVSTPVAGTVVHHVPASESSTPPDFHFELTTTAPQKPAIVTSPTTARPAVVKPVGRSAGSTISVSLTLLHSSVLIGIAVLLIWQT